MSDFNPAQLHQQSDSLSIDVESTAQEGLTRLDKDTIDCVISRYSLPESNGIDLLKRVRERYPELPFILFSDDDNRTIASDAIAAGTTDYIPYEPTADNGAILTTRIETAVEQYRTNRRAEEQHRISGVIRDINRVLVRADSSGDVEQAVCDTLSEADPYLTACIASVDPVTMRIEPRTWGGADRGYFENLDMVIAEETPGRHAPGGRAYHNREIAVSQNIREDSRYEKWQPDATNRDFQALAVVPLEYDTDLYGLLAVFADRPHAFDEREQQLLTELGDDIAHTLHAKQIQSELERTSSRLEALFAQSPDMINVHDTDGNIIDSNAKFCEKTGYDESTLTEMKVWELDDEISAKQAQTLWDEMTEGDTRRLESIYERADGSTFPVEVHIRRIELVNETRFLVISRDITDRKRRQQKLERYGELIENLPVGVFRTTLDGEIVSVNQHFVSLFDAESKVALMDTSVEDLYVEPDARELMLSKLKTDDVVEGETLQLQTFDDEQRWVEVTIRLVKESGHQYLDGIVQDITEQKEREQMLQQKERRFEAMLDDPHILVGTLSTDGTVLAVNDTAMEYIDASREEIQGQKIWMTPWFSEETRPFIKETVKQAADGEYATYDADLTYPNGEPYSVIGVIRPVRNADDTDVVSLIISARDITERKKREQQLDAMDRVLRHNLHNEMSIILGAAETIPDRTGSDVANLTEMIRTSGNRLLELTDKQRNIVDLLVEAPEERSVDVTKLVRRAVENISETHPAAEITLSVPSGIRARAVLQLDEAVSELVENAVTHTADESPYVEVQVKMTGEQVQISVADTGPRIPAEERAILRGDGERDALFHGSGMGLWLVNWIVSQSNGTVTYEQNHPSGNIVTIDLPASQAESGHR